MGIVKAFIGAVSGNLADQWLEVIEAGDMSDTTVFTKGVKVRKNDRRSSNKRGTEDYISDGSIIHVYSNQFMLLVDGGKIVDYTAEEGYYKVDYKSAPSMFNGEFGASLVEAFSRIKFGGVPSKKQQVFFINLQEIKGIKFGTPSPVNYFDNFYNSELFLRAHGTYSIKVTDPIKFYAEAIPRNAEKVDINDINSQYLSEFLEALQSAINRMSVDGIRISQVASKARELSKYMSTELDDDWKNMRGFEILSVGIASISYDEDSKKLINMRNEGAMLGDPGVREGYVQGAVARGMESAGKNPNGSAAAFMGLGFGMNAGGGFMAAASESNNRAMQNAKPAQSAPNADSWECKCGSVNTGKFCPECGKPRPAEEKGWFCTECGAKNDAKAKFCAECGHKKA